MYLERVVAFQFFTFIYYLRALEVCSVCARAETRMLRSTSAVSSLFAHCMPCSSGHSLFGVVPSSSSSSFTRRETLHHHHHHQKQRRRRRRTSTGATTTTNATSAGQSPREGRVYSSSPSSSFSSSSKLSLIVWDVDGTLANTTTLAFEATNTVLKKHELPEISLEQYERGSKYTTPKRFSYHACGDSEGERELGEKLGASFDEYYVGLVTTETAGLFTGIRTIVERTKKTGGVRHAALSNACGEYARRVVTVNELDSIFEVSLGADDVSKAKPEPEGIRELCEKLNVDVSTAVYVGDAPSDGKAAKAAGVHVLNRCKLGISRFKRCVEQRTFRYRLRDEGGVGTVLYDVRGSR